MDGHSSVIKEELLGPKAEERLNLLAIKIAYKVGDEFFAEVVTALAEILGVSHVMITESLEQPAKSLRTLAFYMQDRLSKNIEFELAGTPCEKVIDEGVYFCRSGIQMLFPADQDLVELNAESYCGVSLTDSQGISVGHLCFFDNSEIPDSTWRLPALELIQARCGAEIERVRFERNRAAEQKVIEETKRLAALGTLAAGIAHEINNPLTTIQLFTELALHESHIDKAMPKENLDLMMESVNAISQIVDGVLRVSSNQDTEKTICDLIEIVRRACDLTSHFAEESEVNVSFETTGVYYVLGNPLELQQVFVNLISNAIQATKSAGLNEDVNISIAQEPENHTVLIRNQGRKIPADEQSRIFEPFYTSRLSFGGTGLGLSVSLGIIKAHGGDISVQSTFESTDFLVRIPSSQGGTF